jgi:menaquinone-dependent protoporphyrinogen oxidase
MKDKILLAYASTHGSTQQVAETVAATLRERGLTVDLQLARNVRKLEAYRAVVLGAPLYMFHLHKDALRFLSRHQHALTSGLPIAIFTGGPIEADNGKEWQETREQLDRELAKFPWLEPMVIELIGGRFDPTGLRFPWNLIPALKHRPPSDLRDWEAIRRWAISLAAQLQSAMS